jgi:hypothetical protein
MQTVTKVVSASPDACWSLFTDVTKLTSWVPGLRLAEIITGTRTLPTEIHFEFGARAYTLVYTYDRSNREVRWEPKLGPSDGVTGYVRFDADHDGTRITYALRHGDARSSTEREIGDVQRLVDAFSERVADHIPEANAAP